MARNRIGSKRATEAVDAPRPVQPTQPRVLPRAQTDLTSRLHRVEDSPLSALNPGDILLMAGSGLSHDLNEVIFHAVLACPRCGTLIPVTASQYVGALPLMCGSNQCCCRFRIVGKSQVVYLPVI